MFCVLPHPCSISVQLLVGEETEITNKALSAEDMDTPADKLVYNIEATKSGIIALKESPDYSIENFTQAQIDNSEVIFIHKGSPLETSFCWLGQRHGYGYRSLENMVKCNLSYTAEQE